MRAWRIYDHHAPYAKVRGFDPLSGADGIHKSARWNHKGQPILYSASTPSLALLEVLVWETSESFHERTLLDLEFEDDTETITLQRLVRLLGDAPIGKPEQLTRDFGSNWLEEQRSLALVVPSIVMPYENNIIFNPAHPRADSLLIRHSDVITLDDRLIRSLATHRKGNQSVP